MNRTHVREDRSLMEAFYPTQLGYEVKQVNYIVVSETGQDCPMHRHKKLEETFICLEGQMTIERYGVAIKMGPSDLVHIRPEVWHSLKAKPGTRYLEIRSDYFYADKPDKEYQDETEGQRIEALNGATK